MTELAQDDEEGLEEETAPALGGGRTLVYMPVDELVPAPRNPKAHDVDALRASMERFGFTDPPELDERTGRLVSGHGRAEALAVARALGVPAPQGVVVDEQGRWLAPVVRGWASRDDAEAEAYLVAANRLTERGGWEGQGLADILSDLQAGPGLEGVGYSPAELEELLASLQPPAEEPPAPPASVPLRERFVVPPFSVLDARQGYWQERKRAWLALGIRSEEGRAHNLLKMSDTVLESQAPNRSTPASNSGNDPAYFWKKQEAERQAGRVLSNEEFEREWYEADAYVGGTSIFDPVLCELAYRWWCPAGGRVLDPFAGGSVRGILAAALGLDYLGVDLRPEQVASNEEQLAALQLEGSAAWVVGDAMEAQPPGPFDLVFTCPPYFDLERYSEDARDLSNAQDYDSFLLAYRSIIAQAVERLGPDRFACVVVGDVRDPAGLYRGFVPDTIAAFRAAGAELYNEAVLITAVGSLALRAARIFNGGRKLGKAHQNVLTFIKGDPHRAADACAPVAPVDPAELFGTPLS